MCGTLAGLKQAGSAFAARFDAALVPPGNLAKFSLTQGRSKRCPATSRQLVLRVWLVAALCARRSLAWHVRLGHRLARLPRLSKRPNRSRPSPSWPRPCAQVSCRANKLALSQVLWPTTRARHLSCSSWHAVRRCESSPMSHFAREAPARAAKLVARRCTPLGPCATTPPQTGVQHARPRHRRTRCHGDGSTSPPGRQGLRSCPQRRPPRAPRGLYLGRPGRTGDFYRWWPKWQRGQRRTAPWRAQARGHGEGRPQRIVTRLPDRRRGM